LLYTQFFSCMYLLVFSSLPLTKCINVSDYFFQITTWNSLLNRNFCLMINLFYSLLLPFICTRTPFFLFLLLFDIFIRYIFGDKWLYNITWNIWWNQTYCRTSCLIFVFPYYLVNLWKWILVEWRTYIKRELNKYCFIFWIHSFFWDTLHWNYQNHW
jgi:hypothetical protein